MAYPIAGLELYEDVITPDDEAALVALLDAQPWSTVLRRRVQQYGMSYNYATKSLGPAPPLPEPLRAIAAEIPGFATVPDQVIVNEYLPGQGISAHTDHYRLFGPAIATLSLGHAVPMVFRCQGTVVEVPLPRRSVAVLSGDARSRWTHEIPARRADDGVPRERRISVTFRTVAA